MIKFDYSCFNCGEEADCQFDPELKEWFCEACLSEEICFHCGEYYPREMENNGFTEPNGPSKWEATGKLLPCPTCDLEDDYVD